MRIAYVFSPGVRRLATSSAPLVVATDPLISVLGVPGAPISVTINLGGSMVTTLTGTLDANGLATLLPPYSLPDGARQVTATQTIAGVPSAPSAPTVLSMPNAAKSQALSIIGRMSAAPPAGRAEAIYALISALMAAGAWAKLDILRVLAAHDNQAARLNWVSASYDGVAYNSPIFVPDRGYTGDGSAAYLEASGYNPSAGGTKHTLNDAALGVWVRTPSSVAGTDAYGGSNRLGRRDTTTDDYHYRINDTTSTYGPGGSSAGFFAADRPDAATKRRFRDGVLGGSISVAATTSASYLRLLSTGSAAYSNAEISAAFMGASLSDAQHAALYAALRAYLISVGAITA